MQYYAYDMLHQLGVRTYICVCVCSTMAKKIVNVTANMQTSTTGDFCCCCCCCAKICKLSVATFVVLVAFVAVVVVARVESVKSAQ